MLAAIAFCPQPPLLVPRLAAGAAPELDGLRAACRTARDRLLAAADRVVVLGPGPSTVRYAPGSSGTLAGYGVPVAAALGGIGRPPWTLPPSLTLGAWLLDSAPASGVAVAPDADPAGVAAVLAGDDRLGLLVMGDGSARRSEQAPGYVDARAAGFDAGVAVALRAGDAAALRDLDAVLGAELLAAGVPVWRVAGHVAAGSAIDAELLHEAAPYGVGYFVATWTAR
ncbi:MAG: hypothetical protein ACJ73E_13315 [Mycobacteriales bacterium]